MLLLKKIGNYDKQRSGYDRSLDFMKFYDTFQKI